MYAENRHKEKIQMRKQFKAHEERNVKSAAPENDPLQPRPRLPARPQQPSFGQGPQLVHKEQALREGRPLCSALTKVRGVSEEEEMFKVVNTGKKTQKMGWKRMVTKPTFVGPDFTRRPVKYERFIRPLGLRYKKANVIHPELSVTVQLPIIKKKPQNPLYTQLGVLSKGTVLECNVSELGIATSSGKIVWGRYAQVTNKLERRLRQCSLIGLMRNNWSQT